MIRCKICQIEKEESNFQKYWHSTQQKMRIRKQCTECFYGARLKKTNPDKYYCNNPDYKKCPICSEWKFISTGYYIKSNGVYLTHKCKECQRIEERQKTLNTLKENCGSTRVPIKPNKYTDEYQKECTFKIMQSLEYLYDEETGIWYKPGTKEIVNNKPVFLKIKKNTIKKDGRAITTSIVKMIIELKEKNKLSNRVIAERLDISEATVYKHYRKWKNQ